MIGKFLYVIWQTILSLKTPNQTTVIPITPIEAKPLRVACDEDIWFPVRPNQPPPLIEHYHAPDCNGNCWLSKPWVKKQNKEEISLIEMNEILKDYNWDEQNNSP